MASSGAAGASVRAISRKTDSGSRTCSSVPLLMAEARIDVRGATAAVVGADEVGRSSGVDIVSDVAGALRQVESGVWTSGRLLYDGLRGVLFLAKLRHNVLRELREGPSKYKLGGEVPGHSEARREIVPVGAVDSPFGMGNRAHEAGQRIDHIGIEFGFQSPLRVSRGLIVVAHPNGDGQVVTESPIVLEVSLVGPPARQVIGDQVGKAGGSHGTEQERGKRVTGVGRKRQAASRGSEVVNARWLGHVDVVFPHQDALVARL